MNSRIQNYLTMVGTCINVAQKPEHKTVWVGHEPADFGADMTTLIADYGAITAKAALAASATGGGADAKALAETTLEDAAYILARALANHFKKNHDLDRRGKVNFTKSAIVRLRSQELLTEATGIRNIAQGALGEPGADTRGITAARIAAFTATLEGYASVMSTPRGQIVNRSTLLKEVETDTAALVEHVTDMDDLVLQFDTSDAGHHFAEAWKRARIIVDVGGGHSGDDTPPAPPAPPTP